MQKYKNISRQVCLLLFFLLLGNHGSNHAVALVAPLTHDGYAIEEFASDGKPTNRLSRKQRRTERKEARERTRKLKKIEKEEKKLRKMHYDKQSEQTKKMMDQSAKESERLRKKDNFWQRMKRKFTLNTPKQKK